MRSRTESRGLCTLGKGGGVDEDFIRCWRKLALQNLRPGSSALILGGRDGHGQTGSTQGMVTCTVCAESRGECASPTRVYRMDVGCRGTGSNCPSDTGESTLRRGPLLRGGADSGPSHGQLISPPIRHCAVYLCSRGASLIAGTAPEKGGPKTV